MANDLEKLLREFKVQNNQLGGKRGPARDAC